ncbi:hypothetical protein QBC41DRAFT_369121 [Cercophora samala]|uniref:Uncharacterized protein n=1 Tax=Cercophora samala TaxID=330535 RepID=A0AA40D2W3_9PEZI|nr:hypothetical protein QBC41DRAFT_369121 [Cercophora samala]
MIRALVRAGASLKASMTSVYKSPPLVVAAAQQKSRLGIGRGWKLAEEDKMKLARMFMGRNADPSDRSSPMPIPPLSLVQAGSTVSSNPLALHYEGWLLCSSASGSAETRPGTWPWSPLQHAVWAQDYQLVDIFLGYDMVPPAGDILWIYQVMVYSLIASTTTVWCPFRTTDWFDLFSSLRGKSGDSYSQAMGSPTALAWTLALLRECSLGPVPILESSQDDNCYCYSGSGAPSSTHQTCKGVKQEYFTKMARDIWSLGLGADQLLEKVDARRWHPRYGSDPIAIDGHGILDLKMEGILRPETFLLAVSMTKAEDTSSQILTQLLKQSLGFPTCVKATPTSPVLESPDGLLQHYKCCVGRSKNLGRLAGWVEYPHCRDPVQYAICISNSAAVEVMCGAWTVDKAASWKLGHLYVREASVRLDCGVLAILLRNPIIGAACKDHLGDGDGETPVIFLLQNVREICHGVADLSDRLDGTADFPTKIQQLRRWQACLAMVIGTGVDLDRAVDEDGKSARQYVDEYKGYKGPNRFLREVARDVLGSFP